MHKSEFIQRVAHRANLGRAEATNAVNAMVEEISAALIDGGGVALMGFGVFSVVRRAQRKGVNPRNGEPIVIAPCATARFSPCKDLKNKIQAANCGGESL